MSRTRYQAIEIVITRREGPTHLCGRPERFDGPFCWRNADSWILSQSYTAPQHGGYDKCDVQITFVQDDADNQLVYGTRYDMTHVLAKHYTSLSAQISREWAFYAKRFRPSHMTAERHDEYLAACKVDSALWDRRCDDYEIPGMTYYRIGAA